MGYLETLTSAHMQRAETVKASAATKSWSRQWRIHRGEFYLSLAAILLAVIVWRVDFNSVFAVSDKPSRPPATSAFLVFLSDLGLASLPNQPHPQDHSATRVWVDFRRAVYYCPGDRHYGKVKGGQFTTQGDARLSHYEPAAHKLCE
jgi:hypothetical protein